MSNENNPNFENLLKSVSDKLGKSPEELKKASDAQKIQKILSDKNAANKILSTPQAQSLIKKLLGDK